MTRRMSQQLRRSVLRRIDNFFNEACEAITAPNFEEEFADTVKNYRTPDGVASVFFGSRYTDIEVHYKGETFAQSLSDGDKYQQIKEGSWHGDIVIKVHDGDDNVPETVRRYAKQRQELRAAGNEFKAAARLALEETTVKRVLERLPELEKFLQ